MDKDQILRELDLFSLRTGGIGRWLAEDSDAEIFARLCRIEDEPLTKVQLNQLLAFGHAAPLSDDFFRYYWLTMSEEHPYDVKAIPDSDEAYQNSSAIISIAHLKWGLYRFFIDSLLWFGNVRSAYGRLRSMNQKELSGFFDNRCFQSKFIKERGPALQLTQIAKDDRYMISEMACKSYGDHLGSPGALKDALIAAFRAHQSNGGGQITVRRLLEGNLLVDKYGERQEEFLFSADDVLDESIYSEADIEAKYEAAAKKFFTAREAALKNTRFYLSMVGDLDVYVATSMRNRQHFRNMANDCEKIFSDPRLKGLQLRYFDPTLSAAAGHEDKGLIECLMVKCAKVLVYCAGDRDSYGKDAEAAMALSLGKPVIFFCDSEQKQRFYRDVHPLSRLIEFKTGVAVGAIVTDELGEVSELLSRIFENRMQYELQQPKPGYLRLKEKLTESVVRLQTNDEMLSETFWNYYHNRPSAGRRISLV